MQTFNSESLRATAIRGIPDSGDSLNLLCGQLVKFLRLGIGLSQGLHLQEN